MFKRNVFAVLGLCVAFCPLFSQEAGNLDLSLQDALATAMKNNFDIQIARVGHLSSDAVLSGAKGMYDPNLSLSLSSGIQRQPTTNLLQAGQGLSTYQVRQDSYDLGLTQIAPWGQTFALDWTNTRSQSNSSYSLFDPTYASNLSLTTSMPLLSGFGITNTNKYILKAKLDRQAADSTYSRLLRDSLYDVETSYWNLVYAREQLLVTRKALEVAKEFQKETKTRITVGTLAPIEQVSADAQVAQREEELISAESLVDNSEDILKVILGVRREDREWNLKVIPTDSPNVSELNYEEAKAIDSALKNRDEIKELELGLEKSRIDTKVAKNGVLPTLTLDSSLSYAGSAGDYFETQGFFVDQNFSDSWEQVTGRDFKSWSIGLNFRIPVGNRAQRFNYQNYRLIQTETEISLEKTKQNIVSEVRNAMRNVKNGEKRILAAEANLKLQKEKLASEKKKFDNGLSTSFNVLSYQNDVLSAETTLLKAKIDHQTALSALERAEGRYLEARGIEIDVPLYSQEKKD